MGKRQIRTTLIGLSLAVMAATPASASVLPFTWNPAGAVPSLTGPAFTADTMSLISVLRDVAQPDGIGTARQIGVITGFSLAGGTPFLPQGFGLYLDIVDTHTSGPPPEIIHFTSLSISLKADPGNKNGDPFANFDEIGFEKDGPTGEADDITLATGSMVEATSNLDLATGVLTVEELGTFRSAPGQSGFFSAPSLDGSVFLSILSSNPALFHSTPPRPDGTIITTFNDFSSTAQLVPEPASVAILGIALLGILIVPIRR